MPNFDAGGWLQDNNLSLNDVGSKPGEVVVQDSLGQKTTLNMHEILAKEGIDPTKTNITLNSPAEALNKSPVGLMDRLAMSFGNAKGQVEYLKKNYQDAALNANGDVLVKDKGAWFTVDPRGLGDGDGWDIAHELVGKALGHAGDAVQIAGTIAGAASGIVAGPAGPIAGAGIGGGVGSSINVALGRVLGTYEATPAQMLGHVALDTLISAGGEGIMLGAKASILPAVSKSLSRLAETFTDTPSTRDFAANLLKTAGVKEKNAFHIVNNTDGVLAEVDALKGLAGKVTNDQLQEISVNRMIKGAESIMGNAQKDFSSQWRQKMANAASLTPSDATINVGQHVAEHVQAIGELGIIEPVQNEAGKVVAYKAAPADVIAEKLGKSGAHGKGLQREVQHYMDNVNSMLNRSEGLKGPQGTAQALDMARTARDLHQTLVETDPGLRETLGKTTSLLNVGILKEIPTQSAAAAQEAASWYAKNVEAVGIVKRAAKTDKGVEGFLNNLISDPDKQVTVKNALATVASISGKEAQHIQLLNQLAAHDLVATTPGAMIKGGITDTMGRAAGRMIGVGPAASPLRMAQRISSARQTIPLVAKKLNQMSGLFKAVGNQGRNKLLRDPETLTKAVAYTMLPDAPEL